MTTSKPAASSVEEFCRRVELACLDLPDQLRRRLVADLTLHLAELDDLEALGTPENYARDLRDAMELPRPATATDAGPPPPPAPAARAGFARLRVAWSPQFTRHRVLIATAVSAIVIVVAVALLAGRHSRAGSGVAPATPANAATVVVTPNQGAVVSVPDLVGLTLPAAGSALDSAGLSEVVAPAEHSPLPAGEVIGQSPPAGTLVASGSTITVTVSSGS